MAQSDTTLNFSNLQIVAGYIVIPQAAGSSGGQVGIGMALVLAGVTLVWAEAEAIRVEAAAPVRARTTTNARMRIFMGSTPKVVFTFPRFLWTRQMKQP
jgi:hypothetical protein